MSENKSEIKKQPNPKIETNSSSKKKKKNLSKFALLRCLELYFEDDHDQALALTDFIWEKKDKIC